MKKAWLVLLILAAGGVGLWLLLKPSPGTPGVVAEGEEKLRDAASAPALAGAPVRPKHPPIPDAPVMEEESAEGMDDVPAGPSIHGVVLDDETGAALIGAKVGVERSAVPCPRLPRHADARFLGGPRISWHSANVTASDFIPPVEYASTDSEGKFALPVDGKSDLFAHKPGYLLECVCEVVPGATVTVRLRRGLSIEGIVVRESGQPIEGALVSASPAPGTPMLPGHLEVTTSDKEGKFALTGLLPGSVVVSADHPKFTPTSLEPMEPGKKGVRIVLVPAFLATFKITTDDGKEPDAPSLAWATTGTPPRSGLQLLQLALATTTTAPDEPSPPPNVRVYEPVKVPCDRPSATFTVKSIGYAAWTSDPEPLPPEGGEKAYDVRLERDMSLGSLKITLEDRDGKALSYIQEKAQAIPWRRDNKPIPAGIILRPGEALEMPAIPAGPYGIEIQSPLHSPALLSADVPPGGTAEVKAVLGPPARVRVKFTAPETLIVRFRLMQGKTLAPLYPETDASRPATAQGDAKEGTDPSAFALNAGAEGVVLTGLGTGRYTVEVVSPELVAAPTPVDLVEGDLREVEISVNKR